MGRILRTLLLLFVVAAAAALAVQNNDSVTLQFLFWGSRPLPVWVFLLIAFAAGIVVGGGTLLVDYARLRHALGGERARADEATARADEARRLAEEAQQEVESVRSRTGGRSAAIREEIDAIEVITDDEEEQDESTAVARRGRPPGSFD